MEEDVERLNVAITDLRFGSERSKYVFCGFASFLIGRTKHALTRGSCRKRDAVPMMRWEKLSLKCSVMEIKISARRSTCPLN